MVMITPMPTIDESEIRDRPNAVEVVKVVNGIAYSVDCLPRVKLGNRLTCPECGRLVKTVYLPEGRKNFCCRQDCRLVFQKVLQGSISGLWNKLQRQWPKDAQY